MDKPISTGDLVVVVKPTLCCGSGASLGLHFIAGRIETSRGWCPLCRAIFNAVQVEDPAAGDWIGIVRIKRVPPLEELDGKKDAADKPITLDGEIERLRKMVQA